MNGMHTTNPAGLSQRIPALLNADMALAGCNGAKLQASSAKRVLGGV